MIRALKSKDKRRGKTYRILHDNFLGRNHFENLLIYGRLTLKLAFFIELDQWWAVVDTVKNMQVL